jgi:hypothetical protein
VPNKIYEEEIQHMEPGLVRATLRALSYHIGKENSIKRLDLATSLRQMGFGNLIEMSTFDRHMRMAIAELRKNGDLVCSSSGEGGYYLAKDRAEYDEFAQVEYRSKIVDMSSTLQAMDQAAAMRFGSDTPAEQPSLL